MTDDRGPGATFAMRAERPDGTVIETVRDERGRVTTVRRAADGGLIDRVDAAIHPDGVVEITRTSPDGTRRDVAPRSTTERTNPYGTTVAESQYDGITVRRSYDDDGDLRQVAMIGGWGEESIELVPGGGRTVRWRTPLIEGDEVWDASGCRTAYEVRAADGATYRPERPSGTDEPQP